MKKILLLIFILLCFCLSSARYGNLSSSYDYRLKTRLYVLLGDSLYNALEHNPTIFYNNQPNYSEYADGSIIARINDRYMVFRLDYDPYQNRKFSPIEKINFDKDDSTAFFSANKAIIDWGLDSLIVEALRMSQINIENPRSIKDSISVLNDWNKSQFSTRKAVIFSGPDSVEFNRKYQKLCLIMQWFSDDYLRKCLPDSIII